MGTFGNIVTEQTVVTRPAGAEPHAATEARGGESPAVLLAAPPRRPGAHAPEPEPPYPAYLAGFEGLGAQVCGARRAVSSATLELCARGQGLQHRGPGQRPCASGSGCGSGSACVLVLWPRVCVCVFVGGFGSGSSGRSEFSLLLRPALCDLWFSSVTSEKQPGVSLSRTGRSKLVPQLQCRFL